MLSCSVLFNSLQPHGTVACQVPLSMEFSRQGYRGGLPGDLTDPRMEHPCILFLLHWQAYSLRLSRQGSPGGWNQGLNPNLGFRTDVLCLLALLDLGNAVEIESANAKTFLYLEKKQVHIKFGSTNECLARVCSFSYQQLSGYRVSIWQRLKWLPPTVLISQRSLAGWPVPCVISNSWLICESAGTALLQT